MFNSVLRPHIHPSARYAIPVLLGYMLISAAPGWTDATVNANTGVSTGSTIGNNNTSVNDTGVFIGGPTSNSNISNNENNLTTGNNQNTNHNLTSVNPVLYSPNSSASMGGSSALVLPRNPLALPNAALGRSNFGMQIGLNSNPAYGLANSSSGGLNSMGWFMQAGLNIPFGKIPDVYRNPDSQRLDDARVNNLARSRDVFGATVPPRNVNSKVQGRVMGLSAYNYSTLPSPKLAAVQGLSSNAGNIGEISLPQPKVLALAPAAVFSRPLNTGDRVGLVEVGQEYPYLGHTRSGWVKVLLPSGAEGWTSTSFEYIKFDYTQVDDLVVDSTAPGPIRKAEGKTLKQVAKGG